MRVRMTIDITIRDPARVVAEVPGSELRGEGADPVLFALDHILTGALLNVGGTPVTVDIDEFAAEVL